MRNVTLAFLIGSKRNEYSYIGGPARVYANAAASGSQKMNLGARPLEEKLILLRKFKNVGLQGDTYFCWCVVILRHISTVWYFRKKSWIVSVIKKKESRQWYTCSSIQQSFSMNAAVDTTQYYSCNTREFITPSSFIAPVNWEGRACFDLWALTQMIMPSITIKRM